MQNISRHFLRLAGLLILIVGFAYEIGAMKISIQKDPADRVQSEQNVAATGTMAGQETIGSQVLSVFPEGQEGRMNSAGEEATPNRVPGRRDLQENVSIPLSIGGRADMLAPVGDSSSFGALDFMR